MGDEGKLGKELAALVTGEPLPSLAFQRGDGRDAMYKGGGSQNIPLMRWAVRLWAAPKVAKWDAVEAWAEIFARQRQRWMGTEFGSRIYGTWHMASILAVYAWARSHGHAHLEREAGDWLLHWWCLCALTEASDGQILMCGMRSAGHVPHPGPIEWSFAHAGLSVRDSGHWEREARKWHLGLRQKWDWQVCHELPGDLCASTGTLSYQVPNGAWEQALDLLPAYGLAVGMSIYRTTEGLAVWIDSGDPDSEDDNRNSNTAPIMGAVWRDGRIDWLPPNGGMRIRQKRERVTVREEDGHLVYRGSFHGEHRVPLPGGEVLQRVRIEGAT